LARYINYPTAPFQKEIYRLLEGKENKFLEIIAFRGSAKTTIAMLGFPIWSFITGRNKFIVLLSNTFSQIKSHISNIKNELEHNKLLLNDFGPFEGEEEWTSTSIVIPNYDTKIVAKSLGQKVRGLRQEIFIPDIF